MGKIQNNISTGMMLQSEHSLRREGKKLRLAGG